MRYLVLILMLAAIPSASAIGLIAHAPAENATVALSETKFTFTASQDNRDAMLDECDFIIDGDVLKTIRIAGSLGGSSRQFTADIPDGTYEWRVLCREPDGSELWTENRVVNVVTPEKSEVEVSSSGVFRGSLLHEFTVGSEPITVPRVAPGDFLSVSVEFSPSTITREYYVRGRFTANDTPYFWLTYKQEDLRIYLGRNVTVPMDPTTITASLVGLEGSRGNIVFYPNNLVQEPEMNETQEETEESEEPQEPEEEEQEPETPVVVPEEPQEPSEPEPQEPEERQGFFSWALSMLARLFGA